jgi:Na+-driven multidrug efflux pump
MTEPADNDIGEVAEGSGSGCWGWNSCCAGMIFYPIVGALLLWLIFPEVYNDPFSFTVFPFLLPLGWAVCALGTWLIKRKRKRKRE